MKKIKLFSCMVMLTLPVMLHGMQHGMNMATSIFRNSRDIIAPIDNMEDFKTALYKEIVHRMDEERNERIDFFKTIIEQINVNDELREEKIIAVAEKYTQDGDFTDSDALQLIGYLDLERNKYLSKIKTKKDAFPIIELRNLVYNSLSEDKRAALEEKKQKAKNNGNATNSNTGDNGQRPPSPSRVTTTATVTHQPAGGGTDTTVGAAQENGSKKSVFDKVFKEEEPADDSNWGEEEIIVAKEEVVVEEEKPLSALHKALAAKAAQVSAVNAAKTFEPEVKPKKAGTEVPGQFSGSKVKVTQKDSDENKSLEQVEAEKAAAAKRKTEIEEAKLAAQERLAIETKAAEEARAATALQEAEEKRKQEALAATEQKRLELAAAASTTRNIRAEALERERQAREAGAQAEKQRQDAITARNAARKNKTGTGTTESPLTDSNKTAVPSLTGSQTVQQPTPPARTGSIVSTPDTPTTGTANTNAGVAPTPPARTGSVASTPDTPTPGTANTNTGVEPTPPAKTESVVSTSDMVTTGTAGSSKRPPIPPARSTPPQETFATKLSKIQNFYEPKVNTASPVVSKPTTQSTQQPPAAAVTPPPAPKRSTSATPTTPGPQPAAFNADQDKFWNSAKPYVKGGGSLAGVSALAFLLHKYEIDKQITNKVKRAFKKDGTPEGDSPAEEEDKQDNTKIGDDKKTDDKKTDDKKKNKKDSDNKENKPSQATKQVKPSAVQQKIAKATSK